MVGREEYNKMTLKNKSSTIIPTVHAITPVKLYLDQVKNIMDGVRAASNGQAFIPNQYGGLFGQRETLREKVVLQTVDFNMD